MIDVPVKTKTILVRENVSKRHLYAKAMNICCWPGCPNTGIFNVHHIIPVRKGGSDTYDNFICLCVFCHRHHRLHSIINPTRLVEIRTYKFYQEKLILGYCSDDLDEHQFHRLLLGRPIEKVVTKEQYETDTIQ